MNIVIYARFSSHAQNEQSIEGQLKTCCEFAERNGYKIVSEYIDRAISGTAADNRPEFQRMIADSAKRQFQAVLVYQLDRFARNRYDSATHKNKLKKNGVKVLSARENITDDASGVLMEAVLEGMAEYFSVELSQKVKRGMALTAEKCEFTGSVVPLGYKVIDKKLSIDNETAPIVQRIFELYLSGHKMTEIIQYLNGIGVKTIQGNSYHKSTIRRILENRKYLGIYKYADTEIHGGIPQIIDNKTFADAQLLLEKNRKAPARLKALDENYLLTTRLYCGHCGSPMSGESGRSRNGSIHQYYKCNTARKHGDCKKKPVKKAYVEDLVVEHIINDLTDEKINDMATKISALSAKNGNTDTIKRLKKLLKENEEATANLIKAIETGKAVEMLTAQIEKRQSEHKDLESQLAVERLIRPVLTYDDIRFFLEKLRNGDANDYSYRVILMDVLVERIYHYEGDNPRIEIYCRASEQKIMCPINEPSGSFIGQLAPQVGLEPTTLRLTAACSTD